METKIIGTIGPASRNYSILKEMISSGLDIARINTKYGSIPEYLKTIRNIKKIGKCKILFDIKGLNLIDWLKAQKFDYLAVSFAETKDQILHIRKLFSPRKIKIISKIETKQGIHNIEELLKVSDGIMIARGDLGKNISFEKVPIVQKLIIKKCNKKKKIVITATEMLLSMVSSKSPLKSEVSDVANAILDGSDALMLSEETTIGKNPVLVVKVMRKIILETQLKNKDLKDVIN
ncbi:MAG: pyruvate kinase [Candidatus Pacearchaeota archaeon]|jgi:pyruvate kinase